MEKKLDHEDGASDLELGAILVQRRAAARQIRNVLLRGKVNSLMNKPQHKRMIQHICV